MKSESERDPLLWLKVEGEELDLRSVPIYELGDTRVSIQRIIHKTYLYKHERLRKGYHLKQNERQKLSLQIAERRKSSDAYALIPFIIDPAIINHIAGLLRSGLLEIGKYALKMVLDGSSTKSPQVTGTNKVQQANGSVLTGAIYAEVVNIHNHINNIGQVDKIHLLPSGTLNIPPVTFDADSQDYVRRIVNETILGDYEEIEGYVTQLHQERFIAEIKIKPSRNIKVGLSEEVFRAVRYQTEQDEILRFKGRPIFRLGQDPSNYEEFEAESFVRVRRV